MQRELKPDHFLIERFKILENPPQTLYIWGDIPRAPMIAIIGTRNCTAYGEKMAFQFGRLLAAKGFIIVSGLARGIDTAAHLGALETGKTLAVLGSGFEQIYPKENRGLAYQILSHGALLSEYIPQTPPARHRFPQRNRLVAALAHGVICIEAPVKSGSLITMKIAKSLKKKCFALLGNTDRETFQGNHQLIEKNEALPVTQAENILEHLRFDDMQLPLFSSSLYTQRI